MSDVIIVAIVTGGLSLVGTLFGSYLSHRKSTALIAYRIEQLEKKQDKHNCLIERTYRLEQAVQVQEEKIKVANNRIKDLENEGKKANKE